MGQAGSGQIVNLQGPMSYAIPSERPLCPVGDSAHVTYTEDTSSHLPKIFWTLCYISKPCHSASIQSNLVTSIRASRCVRFVQAKKPGTGSSWQENRRRNMPPLRLCCSGVRWGPFTGTGGKAESSYMAAFREPWTSERCKRPKFFCIVPSGLLFSPNISSLP